MEDESPFMPAHLTTLKIYGDVVLVGGEQGFLGYGIVSRTSATVESNTSRMTMATLAEGSKMDNTNMNGSRKVVYCVPFFAAPGTDTFAKINHTHNGLLASLSGSLGCPHDADSIITTFEPALTASVFVVGDNKGKISLWHMPRNKELCSLSPNSVINTHAIRRITKRLKPELLSVLDLSSMDSTKPSDTTFAAGKNFDASVDHSERVIKLHFYSEDEYLVISTNRRLLLVTLKSEMDPTGSKFCMYDGLSRSRSDSIESVAAMATRVSQTKLITGFDGWIQVDRALPGRKAVFDMFIGNKKAGDDNATRKIVQWKVLENDDDLQEDKVATWLKGNKKTVENVANKTRKCTVSRVEWTEEMFQAMFEKIKPCPVPTADD